MILYHGSNVVVNNPKILQVRYNKDFYYGFYCTILENQAKRWAVRYTGKGIISKFEYQEDSTLNILKFKEMTEEWLDFIVDCRLGIPHNYDIVEGPMANDTIFSFVQDFVDKKITRAAFWELAKFKRPTHQMSFNTEKSLKTLNFLKSYEVYDD